MITTILVGLLSIYFAFIARDKYYSWGLKVSFILIFIFLAFRYDFGNDYGAYLNSFFSISGQRYTSILDFIQFEPLWILLNYSFQHLGFFTMTAVLAFFNCMIYYRFIKKFVPENYYWFAIFIYVFYPSLMLINCSAMRQSIATMLFVFSLHYLYDNKIVRYCLCILLASLFHYTAILLAPFFLIAFIKKRIDRNIAYLLFVFYLSLFFMGKIISPFLKHLIGIFSEKYEYYQDAGNISSGLGFIYYSLLFIIVLLYEKKQDHKSSLFFKISVVSFIIMPLSIIVEMIGRLGIYFMPSIMIVYPNIVHKISIRSNKLIFITIFVIITFYQFFQFFYSETYRDYFMDYHTIFSASKWY